VKYLTATLLVAVMTSSCGGSPTEPSAVNVAGTWGRGSATQGTFRMTSCTATGTFDVPDPFSWCALSVVGQTGLLGLSLVQTGFGLTGTLFLDGSRRALTGTVNGANVVVNASWMQYPGDPNPVAASLIRTFSLNGIVSGQTMSGDFTLRDTFRESSGFTGALTLGFHLIDVSRE
jgi:hypothetical protein